MAAPGSRMRPLTRWSLTKASAPRASGVLKASADPVEGWTDADMSSWWGGGSYQMRCRSHGVAEAEKASAYGATTSSAMMACALVPWHECQGIQHVCIIYLCWLNKALKRCQAARILPAACRGTVIE